MVINNSEFRTKFNQKYEIVKILKLVDHPVWPGKQKWKPEVPSVPHLVKNDDKISIPGIIFDILK